MRFARTTILAGGAALLLAGTAAVAAEKLHTMNVSLPDGSVAQIEYTGDVAPKVAVQPADAVPVAFVDPFAELDRMAAYMEAQHQAMMQQVAAMEKAAAAGGSAAPGMVTVSGNLPAGTHFTYISSTTDANGCTQTVEYSSDGNSQQPKVTRTSAGSCDKAKSDAPVAASAAKQPEPAGPGTKV
ncbi:MAG: hypothetical protein ACXU68_06070 [Croceibacterium sp.]